MKKFLKLLLTVFVFATLFTACAPDDALEDLAPAELIEVENTTDDEEDLEDDKPTKPVG